MKNIKKYLVAVSVISSLGLAADSFAATSAALLREFQQMESGHKADCIAHMKKEKDAFFALIKKEQTECSHLIAESLRKFELLNGKNNEQSFNTILNDAIALHNRQKMEWRAEHDKLENEKRGYIAKHDKEFNAFIKKMNAQKKLHSIEPEGVLSGRQVIGDAPDFPAE